MLKKLIVVAVCVYCLMLASTTVVSAEIYRVYDLGLRVRPVDINDSGQAVGSSVRLHQQALLWSSNNDYRQPVLLGEECRATGINNDGTVVGIKESNGVQSPIIWEGGVARDAGQQGTYNAINDSGLIVGGAKLDDGKDHPILWQNNLIQDLGMLGGSTGVARSINALGQITGYAATSEDCQDLRGNRYPNYHAFVYQDGRLVDIGVKGYTDSYAQCINDSGLIVGSLLRKDLLRHENTMSRSFVAQDGRIFELGSLGGRFSSAKFVNNLGQVVGNSMTSDNNTHAFIWERGIMTDLNSLLPSDTGWVLRDALAINNVGQIVGIGLLNGKMHGFLLTPVP